MLKHTKNTTKSNKLINSLHDAKDKPKKVHIKIKSHRSTARDAKENTFHCEAQKHSNRVLSQVANHANHIVSNGVTNGIDSAKLKHPVDQNNAKTIESIDDGHYFHDNRTLTQKLHAFRKSAR